jgi:hypothetical protein
MGRAAFRGYYGSHDDLLCRKHPGRTLLITGEAGLVVSVRRHDGAACPLAVPTPLQALDLSTCLPMPA